MDNDFSALDLITIWNLVYLDFVSRLGHVFFLNAIKEYVIKMSEWVTALRKIIEEE